MGAGLAQIRPKTTPGVYNKNGITDPKAKKIVEQMFEVYATCKTYTDTGTYKDSHMTQSFVTRFKRPDRICFLFTDIIKGKPIESAYWTQGVRKKDFHNGVDGPGYWDETIETDTWYGPRKDYREKECFGLAAFGFVGLTMGSSAQVPTMIFPVELGSLTFADMADLKYEGVQLDRGVECDVVYSKSYFSRGWIESKNTSFTPHSGAV
jgi:zona occludens toxin (predicted ATPase)